MLLESKGFEVGKAYDAFEAEAAIKKRQPDVLILDVMMPKKSGYELCKELKENNWTKDIPVVLLTAVGEAVPTTTYTHYEGMSVEAEDYIAKPVDGNTLVEAVQRLL